MLHAGSIEIRKGLSSQPQNADVESQQLLHLRWADHHDYEPLSRGYMSRTGLYIYVQMPADKKGNTFQFIYGLYAEMDEGEELCRSVMLKHY